MAKEKLTVNGMTCDHCTAKVEKAVGALDGVVKVSADFKKNMVKVKFAADRVELAKIKQAIVDTGYQVGE